MPIPHKPAATDAQLHELIANRWSPRSFDSTYEIKDIEINSLLEAARWSPSAMNAQPWRFLVGLRGDKNFAGLVSALKDNNLQWAPKASAIIMIAVTAENISKVEVFDAGLAVSALCLQAHSLGFHTHQMAGFSKSKVQEVFSLDQNVEPLVLIAVGKITDPSNLPPALLERELAPRSRKSLSELTIKGLN